MGCPFLFGSFSKCCFLSLKVEFLYKPNYLITLNAFLDNPHSQLLVEEHKYAVGIRARIDDENECVMRTLPAREIAAYLGFHIRI